MYICICVRETCCKKHIAPMPTICKVENMHFAPQTCCKEIVDLFRPNFVQNYSTSCTLAKSSFAKIEFRAAHNCATIVES